MPIAGTAFGNRVKRDLLINLRLFGYSVDSLAMVFHCDKKAVRNQCDRFFILPEREIFSINKEMGRIFKQQPEGRNWKVLDGEKVNMGHSYADYLKKAKATSPLYNRGSFYD